MKTGLIITDLDGTLVDTREANFLAYAEALAEYGYELDRQYFYTQCFGFNYLQFLPKAGIPQALFKAIHDAKTEIYPSCLDYARLNTFLVDMLQSMRPAYATALVTTASARCCRQVLSRWQLDVLFDAVITREDVTNPKPDPEGFELAMRRLGFAPEQTILFEDSQSGLDAARAAGIAAFMHCP